MAARVLVTYATKHGATKGIAQAAGSMLHSCGHQVRLLPAPVVQDVRGFDVVVIGSAVYHDQWLWDARRLVRRVRGELRDGPVVWLFSSGPLGGTPEADAELEATVGLDRDPPCCLDGSLRGVDVRGHAVFPGRLEQKVAAEMDTWVPHGDWRDMALVRQWARRVGGSPAVPVLSEYPAPERGWGLSLGRV